MTPLETIGLIGLIVALLLGGSGLVFFVIVMIWGDARDPLPTNVDDDDPNMD